MRSLRLCSGKRKSIRMICSVVVMTCDMRRSPRTGTTKTRSGKQKDYTMKRSSRLKKDLSISLRISYRPI
jgi:hypothetical protein